MAFVNHRLNLENCMPLTTQNTDWKNHIQYNSDFDMGKKKNGFLSRIRI